MANRPNAPSGGGVGTEQHAGHDRRQTAELPRPREMRYGVLLSTARTVASIEAWLEPQCQGEWTIILDEIDEENLLKKRLRILFELESDKQAFIAGFRR